MSKEQDALTEVEFHRRLTLLAQAEALASRTPVHITPSADTPWRYVVFIYGARSEHNQECGVEELSRVVENMLELSGYNRRMEENFIDRILEELRKQDKGDMNRISQLKEHTP